MRTSTLCFWACICLAAGHGVIGTGGMYPFLAAAIVIAALRRREG